MSKKIVIGNWKMNPSSLKEAEKLFNSVAKNVSNIKKTTIVICPPFVYLNKLKNISKKIVLGAQDTFWEEVGAFTGEISSEMLYDLGVRYTIIGHSERRSLGETNLEINKKIKNALYSGLIPILCVGESIRDDGHNYFNLVKSQLLECLDGVQKKSISKIIIAYEPVWAISTTKDRKDAKPEDSKEMAIFIRKILSDKFGLEASKTKIIYGGSVNEKDVEGFLRDGGVDGVLPGRASLSAEKFSKIIKICEILNK